MTVSTPFYEALAARGLLRIEIPGKTLCYALRELGFEAHGAGTTSYSACFYTTREGAACVEMLNGITLALDIKRSKLVRLLAADPELFAVCRATWGLGAPAEAVRALLEPT